MLDVFLSDKIIVSSLNEGLLAVLTTDIRKEIWCRIDSDHAFAQAYQVNTRWRDEILQAWFNFSQARGFLADSEFWALYNRDWTWILKCKTIRFQAGVVKSGPGSFEENGGVYEGEFRNDLKDGLGKKTFADKSVYIGEWKEDKKNGKGICSWEDGTRYEGSWKDDMYHGFGSKKMVERRQV